MDAINKIIELRKQIFTIQYNQFMNNTLFSLKWWIVLIIAIIYWVIWWKLVDKKKFKEIALVGLVTGIITFFLNTGGIEMTLWAYPTQIFGLVRTYSLFELTILTTSYMLLYQYFTGWYTYIWAVIIFGAIGSFIAQPLFVYFGLYKLISWSYLYSFVVFIFIGIVVKFTIVKIVNIEKYSLKRSK